MNADNSLVTSKLKRWHKYLNEYTLPDWKNIPDIGLYMERVIELLKHYLDYLPPELKEEQFITAATINNYVRMKVMPEPIKKKYYRIHIAYLILILTMKSGITISLIQRLIPADMSEEEIHLFYDQYYDLHRKTCNYFADEIASISAPILDNGEENVISIETADKLVAFSAIMSGFTHLLAEKLLLLDSVGNDSE